MTATTLAFLAGFGCGYAVWLIAALFVRAAIRERAGRL